MFGITTNGCTLETDIARFPIPSDTRANSHANIQVWIAPFSLLQTQACQLHKLSPEEHLRASRMLASQGARNYSLSRAFLRSILASQMNRMPNAVNIQYSANGKPFVSDGPAFNLSHCKHLLVVAVANNDFFGQIGVDVETRVREPDRLRLADKCFTQSERVQLMTYQKGTSRLNAFTRGWTRKEAVVKAIGTGIQTPLNRFDVSLEDSKTCEVIGMYAEQQSLLLASQLKDVPLEKCEVYDLGSRFNSEVALAVICKTKAFASTIQICDVDESKLNALVEFDHE